MPAAKSAGSILTASAFAFLAACASTPPEKTAPSLARSSVPAASPGAAPTVKPPPVAAAQDALFACKMAVSNAPALAPDRRVLHAPRRVTVNGVDLRLAPVSEGCLSSGFGPRGGKRHGGVDYFARRGDVLAAGDGVIKEVESRADFGNMILIDHGRGVYTRYAHLASFDRAFAAGQKVKDGQRLGPIGATGAAGAPHLHYEILSGSFVSGAGSFGLNQHDPFALPGAK